ncbi:RHS repeat-associated core domain-containing protein [Belliella kenyensis]|uniref:RHS repeat-associated core domain-containing protein n=1 Tax=Belliella kenyensis TaxID=1472724 RepID=A0ABV8EMP0_9BACT|nr:RHS repeat-associated core domain-containing protein [Belliella kenyensis]MCH7400769.1 M91 family zinc metallopeptidase [Belliella kenyensis]MDN3601943.1 RHS repeat-associated core domain-containing protein [Belliella kenyensis]
MNQFTQNSYLYNGKEHLTDLNLNLYDYGARMYDPALGRFSRIDRFSEKYFGMSPYQYAANNPIINIDVNGDWIWIIHEEQNYKYDRGKLYSYDEKNNKYVEFNSENDRFLSGLLQGLNDLSSKTNHGKNLVGFFANEKNNAFIEMGVEGEGHREGFGDISIDPSLRGSNIPTEKGVKESPFWLDLGHELAHSRDFLVNGESVYDTWVNNPDSPGNPFRQSEKYATHIENNMRAQAGLPLRTHYASQGSGGYEPTRILNANGTSKFFNVTFHFRGVETKTNIPISYKKK